MFVIVVWLWVFRGCFGFRRWCGFGLLLRWWFGWVGDVRLFVCVRFVVGVITGVLGTVVMVTYRERGFRDQAADKEERNDRYDPVSK